MKRAKDWARKAQEFQRQLSPKRLKKLAEELGVSKESLRAIGIGWSNVYKAYTFPEYDGNRRVVGIALRKEDGSKSFIKGGHRGLTIPANLNELPDPILIVEGPSDVAACLTMGLAAIGRPSNLISRYISDIVGDREILVIGEFDPKPNGTWPGLDGAKSVAARLSNELRRTVGYALPPDRKKDLRGWLQWRK